MNRSDLDIQLIRGGNAAAGFITSTVFRTTRAHLIYFTDWCRRRTKLELYSGTWRMVSSSVSSDIVKANELPRSRLRFF